MPRRPAPPAALLFAGLMLAACSGGFTPPSERAPEAPMVSVLRGAGGDTVLRGTVRANPDGSAAFTLRATDGATCEGLFGAAGNGLLRCSDGLSATIPVPPEVYGQPSGSGVVRAGDRLIGFGWGEDASVETVRALF